MSSTDESDRLIHTVIAERKKEQRDFILESKNSRYDGNEWFYKQEWEAKKATFEESQKQKADELFGILAGKHPELIMPFNIDGTIANVLDAIKRPDQNPTEDVNPLW